MKRVLMLLLCAACLCAAVPVGAVCVAAGIDSKKVNSVTVQMHSGISADIALGRGCISGDQNAGELIAAAEKQGALIAAVNGGFFNAYYERNPEEGYGKAPRCQVTLVRDGTVINGGAGESAVCLGFTGDGRALIGDVAVTLCVEHGGRRYVTGGVNCYSPEPKSLLLFTPEAGADLPVPANAKVAKIVRGRVTEILDSGKMVCAPDTYYFVCGKDLHDRLPSVGASVRFTTEFDKPEWKDVKTAVACGPWLLRDGKNVFAENKKYPYLAEQKISETAVAQRSFAAILGNGSLLLGTCSASPKQVTEYLLTLGATDAMLLDGGASSMLWTDGRMLTNPGRKLNNVICIYEEAPAPNVTVDGKRVVWPDAEPFIDANGRTMVPLRPVGEALGLRVGWDGDRNEASFSDGTRTLYFPIGSKTARTGSGETIQMDTAAVILSDRTYAPVRYLAEYFGRSVSWDAATRTVVIR